MPDKSWNCPVCAAIKKNKLLDQVGLYFAGDKELYFYTFTEQADSGRNITSDLASFKRTLIKGLKERVTGTYNKWKTRWEPRPKPKAYLSKEFTLRGVRHIHMIADFKMDNEELTQRWRHATHGVSDQAYGTQALEIKKPAAYMMKYMSKQLSADKEHFYEGEYQFRRHERRYSFWKPEGMKSIPKIEWIDETRPKGEIDVYLHPQWNTESKYYQSWYNDLARKWGVPFIEYMEQQTSKKLNFKTLDIDTMFTGVEQYDRTTTGNTQNDIKDNENRWNSWKQILKQRYKAEL